MTYQRFPPQFTDPVDPTQGGTGSSTALNNNRVMVSSGGDIVEASAITASRALASNASGIPVAATTTATELGYVNGVTSAIQTQIDAKASTASVTTLSNTVTTLSGNVTTLTNTVAGLASAPTWAKYSITHTALQAAALTNDIELFSLPAKTVIHKVIIKNTTAFAGTTSYTLSVGIVGTLAKYIAAFDVMQAVSDTTFGVAATTINATPENFGSATSIRVAAVSTVENLDQSSAGAADIYVQTSTLP